MCKPAAWTGEADRVTDGDGDGDGGRKRIRLVLRLHVGGLCLRSCELAQQGIWWLESNRRG